METRNQYKPESVSHPGNTLEQKLKELGMGKKEFAVRVDKPEKTITSICTGESSITPEMAVKFEGVLKIPANFWLKRQNNFDEYKARESRKKVIEDAKDWARAFPYAQMAKLGWVKVTKVADEKVEELFSYFSVSTKDAWQNYYYEKKLLVDFRISLAHVNKPYAVAAWLRKGELEAKTINTETFSKQKLKKALPILKKVMAEQPKDFFNQIQKICADCGVIMVYTPCLSGAPINGSTRWMGDTPLIQLSARYKTNDKFWFTFFHELGHIILHGKKYISIENVKYDDLDASKESEADDFAISWTFTEQEEKKVLEHGHLNGNVIRRFAEEFGTHPAIIIGRFQHKGLIHYSVGREFIESIELG